MSPPSRRTATIRSLRSAEVLIPPGKTTVARRPLTNLSFAVNYAIGKLAVRSYHAGNLLIHLLAALTLFGIVRRTLLLPALRQRFGGASTGLAAAAALIWALHPLQTESVTYVVQRAESLMGICYLLTLYAVIRGASSERPWPWYAAAIAVCALGMGAKEVMATAPIVVLLYDRAFLSGTFRETFRRRGRALSGAGGDLGRARRDDASGQGGRRRGLRAGCGAMGIRAHAAGRHSALPAAELLAELALLRLFLADRGERLAGPAGGAAIAALLAAILWALWRAPALGFFGAWFFLVLAPSSSFVPIADGGRR